MSRANRINKALTQKMYLVKIEEMDAIETEIPYIKFHILGTLGYVYEVFCDDTRIFCNCQDAEKHKHFCKHVYFVFYKVMNNKLSINLSNLPLTAVFDSFIDNIFSSKINKKLVVNEKYRDLYEKLLNQNFECVPRKKIIGDSCPICFEDFTQEEIKNNKISYCNIQCGTNFHKSCFNKWAEFKNDVTCVFCRSILIQEKKKYIKLVSTS